MCQGREHHRNVAVPAAKIKYVYRIARVAHDLRSVELRGNKFISLVRDQEFLVFGKFVRVLQLALGFDDPRYNKEAGFKLRGEGTNRVLAYRRLADIFTRRVCMPQRVVEYMGTTRISFFDLCDEIENAVKVMRHFLELAALEAELAERGDLFHFVGADGHG